MSRGHSEPDAVRLRFHSIEEVNNQINSRMPEAEILKEKTVGTPTLTCKRLPAEQPSARGLAPQTKSRLGSLHTQYVCTYLHIYVFGEGLYQQGPGEHTY